MASKRPPRRCTECGEAQRLTHATTDYPESGLDNVKLVDVPVWECRNGHREVEIPKAEQVHGLLVNDLTQEAGRADGLRDQVPAEGARDKRQDICQTARHDAGAPVPAGDRPASRIPDDQPPGPTRRGLGADPAATDRVSLRAATVRQRPGSRVWRRHPQGAQPRQQAGRRPAVDVSVSVACLAAGLSCRDHSSSLLGTTCSVAQSLPS